MPQQPSPIRYLFTAAAIVVVVAGLREAQTLVVPFLLALFLAVTLTPPLRWLEKKRVPTPLAMLLIVAVLALIAAVVLGGVSRSVSDFSRQLPRYQRTLTSQVKQLEDWLDTRLTELSETLEEGEAALSGEEHPIATGDDTQDDHHGESAALAADEVEADRTAVIPPAENGQLQLLDPQWALRVVKLLVGELGALFSNAAIILITVIFMLLEASRFPAKFRVALGESTTSLQHLAVIIRNVRRYIAIKTLTSMLTGLAVTLLTLALGVDYPVLWGLLAFLFNYIPNIGSILAAIPAVVLALVDRSVGVAAGMAVGYVAINFFISYAIEPRYMGQGLGLSTLVVFLSLVFWGWVLGPVGMLLSAPLTMVVKIVLEDFEETRWLGVLLGSKAPGAGDGDKPRRG